MLKLDKLKGVIPDSVLAQLPAINAINGPLRLSHFLAQAAHESLNFTVAKENLNYSSSGLAKVFGKYFDDDECVRFQRNPMAIANRVYAGRMGNGDAASFDGWTYRGRGYLQLTGKDNYKAFSVYIGADCLADPDLVSLKYPLASAAFFFDTHNLWKLCDKGASKADVVAVTRVINGGVNGIADRVKQFNLFFSLISS